MAKRRRHGSYAWTHPKTGYLYARVRVQQSDGTCKPIYRRATNLTHAKQLADEIKAEYEMRGQAFIDGRKMTLGQLADWYKTEYVIEPVYVDGVKVEGLRTWHAERLKIDRVIQDIGVDTLINDIDEETLRRFRRRRLKTVKISSANRDLETVRAMMRRAIKKKWRKDAIDFTELLDKSLEQRRTVTITKNEITSILKAAHGFTYSPRLYALLLTLYDGGARPAEIYPVNDYHSNYNDGSDTKYFPLRWRSIFDDNGDIVPVTAVTATKGRRIMTRFMVVTDRMAMAYRELWNYLTKAKNIIPEHGPALDNLIFPQTSFQTAWEIVRADAGVPHLRLRDLRRDWVTRLAKEGYSDRLGQRGAGHQTMQQTFEYTEFDMAAAMEAKAILDRDVIDLGAVG